MATIELNEICPNCGELVSIEVDSSDYNRWKGGALVQDAFPTLTATQRETVMTGICSDECWLEYLGGIEDE